MTLAQSTSFVPFDEMPHHHPVPEPSTYGFVLMAICILTLFAFRHRRFTNRLDTTSQPR